MEKPLVEIDKPLPQIREEGFISCYANQTEVTFTQWDMRITFGEIVEKQDDSFQVIQRATVVMSLHHAKAAIGILARGFANLEKRFGEIPLIESVLKK